MSEIKVMWGNPPKPYLWKAVPKKLMTWVEDFEVTSPLLKHTLEVTLTRGKRCNIRLHLAGTKAFGYLAFTKDNDRLREEFFGGQYWEEVRGFIRDNKGFIDRSVKVASDEIKVMWGNPPKPFLWKVEDMPYMRKTEGAEYFVVTSPLLKYTLEVKIVKGKYSGIALHLVGTNAFYDIDVQNGSELRQSELRKRVFGEAFWGEIKLFLKKHGAFKDPTVKVASSDIKVMWGDPPKPFLWEAIRTAHGDEIKYEVNSPLLKCPLRIRLSSYGGRIWLYVHLSDLNLSYSLQTHTGEKTLADAEKKIFSPAWWGVIKDYLIYLQGFKDPTVKVASNDIKVMWGDPPKPFLWEAKESRSKRTEDFVEYVVTSPLLKFPLEVRLNEMNGKVWFFVHLVGSKAWKRMLDKDVASLAEAEKKMFSPVWWGFVSKFLKDYRGLKDSNIKVASPRRLKAQWGNPPKPFLWDIQPTMYDSSFAEGCFLISSPVLKDSFYLDVFTNHEGYVMQLRIAGGSKKVFGRVYPSKEALLDYFLTAECWAKYVKPFTKSYDLLVVGKVG